jgi:hypothetical protein
VADGHPTQIPRTPPASNVACLTLTEDDPGHALTRWRRRADSARP